MKRRDLIKLLERNGWYFKRAGGNHDIYTNGVDNEAISRQKESWRSMSACGMVVVIRSMWSSQGGFLVCRSGHTPTKGAAGQITVAFYCSIFSARAQERGRISPGKISDGTLNCTPRDRQK